MQKHTGWDFGPQKGEIKAQAQRKNRNYLVTKVYYMFNTKRYGEKCTFTKAYTRSLVHKNYVIVTFYVCPSASLRSLQQQYIQPPSGNHKLMQNNIKTKGIIIKQVVGELRWRGREQDAAKYTFLSGDFFSFACVHGGCIVVVASILAAGERCWCSEPAGTSLIPNTTIGSAGL